MKKCPFCAEEIQEDAIKCKHCSELLDTSNHPRFAEEKILDPQAPVAYSLIHQKGVVSCMNFTLRRLCRDDLAAVDQLRAALGWN